MAGTPGALPTFIVIGAARSGTTALHEYLGLHPGIMMSEPKELNFFVEDWNWTRGIAWYRSHWDAKAPIRGESSPHYAVHPMRTGVPALMARTVPDARLIYLVRDPLARIASAYTNFWYRRAEWRPPEALTADSRHIVGSRYMHQLDQYLPHYAPDRILVVDHRELLQRRSETLDEVFTFLGAEPGFRHADYGTPYNATGEKRRMTALGAKVRRGIRGTPLDAGPVRGAILGVERLVPRSKEEPPDVRARLRPDIVELLREDAARLRAFTGMALDHWSV